MSPVLRRPVHQAALCVLACLGLSVAGPAPAGAAEAAPQWTVTSVSRPTNLKPGGETGDAYLVDVTNTGGAASDGSPITITDELPEGMTLGSAGAQGENPLGAASSVALATANFDCIATTCTYTGVVAPDQTLTVRFPVDVALGEQSTATNTIQVAGGGAPHAEVQTPTTISSAVAAFGVSPGGTSTALSSLQAGAHADVTTSVAFNTTNPFGSLAGDAKEVVARLPAGFAGDLVDTPSCTPAVFLQEACSVATQIGVTTVTLIGAVSGAQIEPVYNLAPDPGEVAKFGFDVAANLRVEAGVFLEPDYDLDVVFENISQTFTELDQTSLTIWGVPSAHVHDPLRFAGKFGAPSEAAPAPFMTNPTACGLAPLQVSLSATSWQHPDPAQSPPATTMAVGPLVGCDRLIMQPTLLAEPTAHEVDAPTGLDVTMGVPQTYANAQGIASPTLRRAVVTLPEGMTLNPSAGAGLAACSVSQLSQEEAEPSAGKGCPNESKLGSVRFQSPSLKEEATGSVFLAEPHNNPFGSLIALFIVARIPDRGVIVRAAGEVAADPLTGRLVGTFDTTFNSQGELVAHDGLPPLPFSSFSLNFRQGQTSPLVTPSRCGSYDVLAQLTAWSAPSQALALLAPPFAITSGIQGGPCPAGNVPPFAPHVLGGTVNNAAGSYSPFYLRIERHDGEQEITGFSTTLPPGLTGNLSGIPFCGDREIAAGRSQTGAQAEEHPACPAASQIGHSIAEAGVGGVLVQTPGRLYLSGPFEGAPFSVVSVTSAKVGPFDLGTVVVHLPLSINPTTVQVSILAGAADRIPHIIQGVVVHLRTIRVYIDHSSFILNPTSCNPMSLSASVIGAGADPANAAGQRTVGVTSPFQGADCARLGFSPRFSASVSGRNSKANGASLTAKIVYPAGSLGSQANVARVKVELPRQLPSRLTTLQKACVAATFNSDPASCPPQSIVGHAKVITPILPVPLEGPAYFVSHGGETFPSLVVVLQGYGVTVNLVGTTFISKAGITSTTFNATPDVPFSSFELTLPQGRYSALGANTNLCSPTKVATLKRRVTVHRQGHTIHPLRNVKRRVATALVMRTEFTGQNGAQLDQDTRVVVGGCPKAKKPARTVTKRRRRRK